MNTEELIKFNKKVKLPTIDNIFGKTFKINTINKKWLIDMNKIYNIDDIIDIRIIEENKQELITATTGTDKRKVSITKGLIGGAMLGPVGAIVGGSQGKVKRNAVSTTKAKYNCYKLEVKIIMKNTSDIIINLINQPIEVNSWQYNGYKKYINNFISTFEEVAGRKFNQDITQIENQTNLQLEQPQEDKYDKLRKLKELLDDNIISQEEFDKEKDKILSE